MPSYTWACVTCGHEDFELRSFENKGEPPPCPHAKDGQVHETQWTIGDGTLSYVRIKDSKLWASGRGDGKLVKKRRTRVLGTDIGRIRPQDLTKEALEKEARKGD